MDRSAVIGLATTQRVGDHAADGSNDRADRSWRELEAVQAFPSRDPWRLPRHENLAWVRSLLTHPDAPDRPVAGVVVGCVHVGTEPGETPSPVERPFPVEVAVGWTTADADVVGATHRATLVGRRVGTWHGVVRAPPG